MTSPELVSTLLQATFATSAAIVLVLFLRRPLRRLGGARVAYAAWSLVPAAFVAGLLPAATPAIAELPVVVHLSAPARMASTFATDGDLAWRTWTAIAWLAGALACGTWMLAAQRRFHRSLGDLQPFDDAFRAGATHADLPATLGFWRPRIIMPADFEQRFDPAQRALVLAHERAHIARRDLQANAAAALLRCLFWFNPLMHVATRRFRHDQELACDADVLAARPEARRVYGATLLHAQLSADASPLGCHFGFGHPLKERIAMLKETRHSTRRRRAAGAVVAALAIGTACVAWAAQPQAGAAGVRETPIKPIAMPAPDYPETARKQRIGGEVSLIVGVAADGSVSSATVDRSEPEGVFDAAALAAVKQWKFQPLRKDGKAVPGRIRVPVRFDPPKASAEGS
jgi:TonB family protein